MLVGGYATDSDQMVAQPGLENMVMGYRECTREEIENIIINDILEYRRHGFQIDEDLHYNALPNELNDEHLSAYIKCTWIYDSPEPHPFSEQEIDKLVQSIQGDFRYPYPPIERSFRVGSLYPKNNQCPICKKSEIDEDCEIFMNWKDCELRQATYLCISCWDQVQSLFDNGWQIKVEQIITQTKRNPIQPSLKHEVLKKANYRCQDCGISNKDAELQIDHIVPVTQGGTDELSNLQVLCRDCNIKKNNRCWRAGT